MSIALSDILAITAAKRGIIPASIEATLTVGASVPVRDIMLPESQREDFVRAKIIQRLYGDILQDFESLLATVPEPDNPEFARLRDEIRTKLRGEGRGEAAHKAPDCTPAESPRQN